MGINVLFLSYVVNAATYIVVNAFVAIKLVNCNKHKTYLMESDYIFLKIVSFFHSLASLVSCHLHSQPTSPSFQGVLLQLKRAYKIVTNTVAV